MLHRWSGVRPAAVGVLVVLEVLKAVLQIILTIEFYTVVMSKITFMLIITSTSSPRSFIPGLKPPFSANPSHRSLLQDRLHGFP